MSPDEPLAPAAALVERASPDSVIDCQCPNCQPSAVAVRATAPAPLVDLVSTMLALYGVRFTDALSREVAIDSWCRQFEAALRAVPSRREPEKP